MLFLGGGWVPRNDLARGGGTPSYKPLMIAGAHHIGTVCAAPNWFLCRFGLKTSIDFAHLVWNWYGLRSNYGQ